jgi:MFS family permease
MIKKINLSNVFFGWWMVIATGIVCFLGVGFAAYGFSVLFKSLSGELGLSRAATSMASSVQALGYGIVGPAAGWASDKYGPKWVILAGIFIMVAGCVLMFFVDSLWSLLVVWGILIGIGYSLGFTVITDKAIVNWFVKKSGIALNVKFAMQSISGMVLLPVIAWLITQYGWRWTCLIAGIVITVVCFPLVWIFIKPKRPEYYGLLPDGEARVSQPQKVNIDGKTDLITKEGSHQFTLKQALKSHTFWTMILLFTFSGLASPIMTVHCIPFLTDMGISPVQAASMMSIWLTCSIPVRIIVGFVVDRLKTRNLHFLLAAGYIIQAVGVALFLFTKNPAMIYVWFVLYGIGSGLSSAPFLTMLADYFGRQSFGAIIGVIMLFNLPVNLAAPVYVGWVYDSTMSYTNVFTLFAILLAGSAVVSCFITTPRLQRRNTTVNGYQG